MAGRVATIYCPGDEAPVSHADGSIDEPRVLILWSNGKWTLDEHHAMGRVTYDVDQPHDRQIIPEPTRTFPRPTERLAQGLKALLRDMEGGMPLAKAA